MMMAPAARADGDPASDVLVAQNLFLPPDAGGTLAEQNRLEATVLASARAGFSLRVAVIASRQDLGSIGALWGDPEGYAGFLGTEISLAAPSRVLVVMPRGFGLSVPGASVAADEADLERAPRPPSNRSLTVVATDAVLNLARALGHPIPQSSIAVAAAPAGPSGPGPIAILVLVAGALAVLGAWTFSLRARPLGHPNRAGATS